jgi:hypothetical protein
MFSIEKWIVDVTLAPPSQNNRVAHFYEICYNFTYVICLRKPILLLNSKSMGGHRNRNVSIRYWTRFKFLSENATC